MSPKQPDCAKCGKPVRTKPITVEPATGLPAAEPAGKPFHAKCAPPVRMAACYVCHLAGPDDYDELVAADWVCSNCGGEVVTIAWGRAEFYKPAKRAAKKSDKPAAAKAA